MEAMVEDCEEVEQTISSSVVEEIKQLESRDGKVYPENVVEFAKDEQTALHARFCWDDAEAGEQYRLLQAERIIREVKVRIVANDTATQVVRAYYSLASDRKDDGGYTSIVKIMGDAELKAELLKTAKVELSAFRRKYAVLSDLSEVNVAIDRFLIK